MLITLCNPAGNKKLITIFIPFHLLKIGISETPELKALTSQIRIVTIANTCIYLHQCKGTDIEIKLLPDYTQ